MQHRGPLPLLALLACCVASLSAAASPSSVWTLHTLSRAAYPMAQCLDGTMGGFYVQWGDPGETRWVVHLEGGGWCFSPENCAERAAGVNPFNQNTSLGGSGGWQPRVDCSAPSPQSDSPICLADGDGALGAASGSLSNDPAVNPHMAGWNKVFVGYCDGGSFAGARLEPLVVNATTRVFLRGRYILDAAFTDIAALMMARPPAATDIVLKGCSAGGLAVFLHADYLHGFLAARLPAARVVAAPGAGFFIDVPSFSNASHLATAGLRWVFDQHNVSDSLNAACVAAHAPKGPDAVYACFWAAAALPFIRTPLFIAQSLVDRAQQGFIMDLGCTPAAAGNCSAAQLAYLSGFRAAMLRLLRPALAPPAQAAGPDRPRHAHGAWLVSCSVHCLEDDDGAWDALEVQGQTQRDTFWAWFTRDAAAAHVVVDGEFGTNPSCALYSSRRRI
jgi:hypothetical protein